ncbi:paraneoplastic antigen Ma6E-like [Bubalus kerabau]|uniref:paraneoplastic antigen Ma6E-like n=1 Tax=Bubalus carabanensis TaxID=3119969 RepID=UPI00244EFF46|nr:paraneoplastic antigen Ma6E-like [Bubalus carabanensis]
MSEVQTGMRNNRPRGGESPAVAALGPSVVRDEGPEGGAGGEASAAGRMGGAAVSAGTRLPRAPGPGGSARRAAGAAQRAWACGWRQGPGTAAPVTTGVASGRVLSEGDGVRTPAGLFPAPGRDLSSGRRRAAFFCAGSCRFLRSLGFSPQRGAGAVSVCCAAHQHVAGGHDGDEYLGSWVESARNFGGSSTEAPDLALIM